MGITSFANLDLLSVGIAIAGIGVLGFVVFMRDRKSITNQMFLFFAGVTIIWGAINYLDYHVSSPFQVLWMLRLEIAFAVLHAFSFFQLCYVFPQTEVSFSKRYKFLLVPLILITFIINLTPLVFPSIAQLSGAGTVSTTVVGPGIYLFIFVVVGLIGAGIFYMVKKYRRASGMERIQSRFLIIGAITMFALLITFNLILPALFLDVRFIPLGAIFILPFIAFTAYAIIKHHLLNVKVISTEILTFVLAVVTLSEVVLAQSLQEILFRVGEFILVSIIGTFLIRSVLREVEQREELERLNKQIADANRKLEELSHFKSELLSLASHQIRSPLAATKGFISLILDGSYGPVDEKAKEALRKVQRSADELINLINTLLDVRKVEEGKMEYQFARTDLAKIVADVVELMKPLAESKGLEFVCNVGNGAAAGAAAAGGTTGTGKEVWINADGEKLKQIVQNLVDNAIKYTPSGFVRVELVQDGGTASVTVADSGLGIPATLIPYLFEEFIRDERVKKEVRGTGLGLFIAKKITEAHGGKIWAESAGEGKGSAFHLTVPLMK